MRKYIKISSFVLGLLLFIFFALYKVNKLNALYEAHYQEFQLTISNQVNLLLSGDSKLNDKKIASLLEASANREVENFYIFQLRKYLFIFVALFFLACFSVIVLECRGKN